VSRARQPSKNDAQNGRSGFPENKEFNRELKNCEERSICFVPAVCDN
jgi:hypothetical protein